MSIAHTTRIHTAQTPADEPGTVAFARLYAEFFDPIFGYCRGRLGDTAAAEDATSTVFARALAAGPRYGDPGLRSWLFGIAHNVLANRFRASRPHLPLEAAEDIAGTDALLDDAVVANEERDRLMQALRLLPTDQRRVIELRIAGLTGPEIARVLDRSHGAIKMLQLRAFARMREALAAGEEDVETKRHG